MKYTIQFFDFFWLPFRTSSKFGGFINKKTSANNVGFDCVNGSGPVVFGWFRVFFICVSVCVKGPLKHHWNRWVDRLSAKKAVLAQNQFDPIWFLLLLSKGLQINQNVQSFPFPVLSLELVPYRAAPYHCLLFHSLETFFFLFQFSYRQSVNERKKVNFLESQPPVKIFTFKSILHLFQFDFSSFAFFSCE